MSSANAIERLALSAASDANAILAFSESVFSNQTGCHGALAGIPVAVKDNICTLEYPTTCGSRMLEGYTSPYEASAVTRLKEAGAVIACKTNLDEFGMGSSTENSAFGRTLHPLDRARVPGGSSGGSAALVAAGVVDHALGSETGGSVRQPAAFCGVVGIKPTYGRVSRYGLVAFGSSLDQIGVLGRDVACAAELLACISGPDRRDSTSAASAPVSPEPPLADLAGVTVGLPVEYFPDDLPGDVRAACDLAVARMREAGADVLQVSLPHTATAVAAYYVIAPAEASSNLARFDGVRYGNRSPGPHADVGELYRSSRGAGFGEEVKRRIVIGTYVLSAGYYEAYYAAAQVARRLITADFVRVFDSGVDVLFTPTVAGTAFEAGRFRNDPLSCYREDMFVCPVNLAGLPAMNLPLGRSVGLPVGGQLIAPRFADERMIAVAGAVERLLEGETEVR